MSKGVIRNGGAMPHASAGGRSKITRSEFNDGLLRDNVRMDNKHQRSLKVHERAKNVVSRTIDKEAQLFKQKQASNKTRLPGLNAQGQKQRVPKTDTTNWIPDFKTTPRQETTQSQNGTLSPPISQSPNDRKSPLSPREPIFHYGVDQSKMSEQEPGHVSPDIFVKGDHFGKQFGQGDHFGKREQVGQGDHSGKGDHIGKGDQVDKAKLGKADAIPQRRLMRLESKERYEDPFETYHRVKSATRKLYLDSKGHLREETVFDFLSKPKYNTELKKRLDTRIRLEKEFTPRRSSMTNKTTSTSNFGLKTSGSLYKNPW